MVRPATKVQSGCMWMQGKGIGVLKSPTHLTLEGAALPREKEKPVLEAAGSTRASLYPALGGVPRLAGTGRGCL